MQIVQVKVAAGQQTGFPRSTVLMCAQSRSMAYGFAGQRALRGYPFEEAKFARSRARCLSGCAGSQGKALDLRCANYPAHEAARHDPSVPGCAPRRDGWRRERRGRGAPVRRPAWIIDAPPRRLRALVSREERSPWTTHAGCKTGVPDRQHHKSLESKSCFDYPWRHENDR